MHALQHQALPNQVLSDNHQVLAEVLYEGINLAVWQRSLAPPVTTFVNQVLAQPQEVVESLHIVVGTDESLSMPPLLPWLAELDGYAAFVADVSWLVQAYACLLGARRVGLRLRSLAKPMCPRFHVDHVPLRLISTYAGVASEWLEEGVMPRSRLGDAAAEPGAGVAIQQLQAGWVALAKGEKWPGNEGAGLIHRSPTPAAGERRLLLTLDWLE